MIIKELKRINLGIPCNWDVEKCPYYKNGIDNFNRKLECNSSYGVRCNGDLFNITYSIDNELYEVIESQALTKVLENEINVNINKDVLLKMLNQGYPLNYIIK